MPRETREPQADPPTCEICILAGGLSRRMGRDKALIRLGKGTMLGHIRATAKATGLRVRVIRRDSVPRCGPIGGVHTAFQRTRGSAILFLACDMPFVGCELIQRLVKDFSRSRKATFVDSGAGRGPGFPFVLPASASRVVSGQITRREFSLQTLAKVLQAKTVRLPRTLVAQLFNLNVPSDWLAARLDWKRHSVSRL